MKQLANWRGARVASLVPNILPRAEAAAEACISRYCWCQQGNLASCYSGTRYCTSCHGRAIAECHYCCDPCA
jgi:hypothetical protein